MSFLIVAVRGSCRWGTSGEDVGRRGLARYDKGNHGDGVLVGNDHLRNRHFYFVGVAFYDRQSVRASSEVLLCSVLLGFCCVFVLFL